MRRSLFALALCVFFTPVMADAGIPKGAVKVTTSNRFKVSSFYCARIKNKWIPGIMVSGHFYAHATERSDVLADAKRAKGKKKAALTTRAAQLKSQIAVRAPSCLKPGLQAGQRFDKGTSVSLTGDFYQMAEDADCGYFFHGKNPSSLNVHTHCRLSDTSQPLIFMAMNGRPSGKKQMTRGYFSLAGNILLSEEETFSGRHVSIKRVSVTSSEPEVHAQFAGPSSAVLSAILKIPSCDINRDGAIDFQDIALITNATGQAPMDSADLRDHNGDGLIDSADVTLCAQKTMPPTITPTPTATPCPVDGCIVTTGGGDDEED